MENVFDVFRERGFFEQVTDEEGVRRMLETPTVCYIGFDPTSDSFHAGSLVPIMALAHMQRHGHTPIALVGGGTAMIGDPSGKTELRRVMPIEEIDRNAEGLKGQLAHFISFGEGGARMLNNADWLRPINYIEFLRDVGRHFSVNKMLAAESYRQRLETGLNFIEFNYMLLQAYDFLHLYRVEGCTLQMGGNDQWGNIIAGADLIRRVESGEAEGLTFPLLTTASGSKMGKTERGAIWLDPQRTSPYEYYQYWINCDDRDVGRFLALFTFLPMEEVRRLAALEGADLREAKRILAREATSLLHGTEAAAEAQSTSRSLFAGGEAGAGAPTFEVPADELAAGIPAYVLFADAGLCSSRSEARRLVKGGGAYVNERRVEAFDEPVTTAHLEEGAILLRAGKKKHMRVIPTGG